MMDDVPSRAELFLDHLDRVTGGVQPEFFRAPRPEDDDGPPAHVIVYRDLPGPGMLTAFTFGLSGYAHPAWKLGRPELSITVASTDTAWAHVLGYLVVRSGGEHAFAYGNTVELGEPVAEGSAMSAFVVFAPAVLDRDDALGIDVGDALPVNIQGVYPLHTSERRFVEDHGLEAFWQRDWDPYDVTRSPAA